MKKTYLISLLLILGLIIINVVFFRRLRDNQLDHQKNILLEQARLCGSNIEDILDDYQNDLNWIIYQNNDKINSIFTDPGIMNIVQRDLEYFYSRYLEFITNISIYDNKNSYLGIYINEKDDFVIDTFARQNKNILEIKEGVILKNGYYYSYIPFFHSGELAGNIVIEINFLHFVQSTFALYKIDNYQWQWLITDEGTVLFTNNSADVKFTDISMIADSIGAQTEGTISLKTSIDGRKSTIASAYYPLTVFNKDLGIIFSLHPNKLTDTLSKNILMTILNFALLFILIMLFINHLYKKNKSCKKLMDDLLKLRMTFQNIPIGILVLDNEGRVKSLNQNAQQLLLVNSPEDIIGKKADSIIVDEEDNNRLNSKYVSYKSNRFIQTKNDGIEYTLLPKKQQVQIAGEKVTIVALIDLSPIEKLRKQEAASNQSKLQFLAKMSYELRIPLNEIINHSEQLMQKNLDEKAQEKILLIKNHAVLLLNIINDIPDYSTIETGRVMLEEIPFSLSEEIDHCLAAFKTIAKEKELKLKYTVADEIPDKLIGDPMKLRKVLSILVGNAINCTDEGSVTISIELQEKYNSILSLLIIIEDSGPAISAEDAKEIFNDFEPDVNSLTGKKAGKRSGIGISKQLVELMNGEIWLESPAVFSDNRDWPGSRFCFTTDLIVDERVKKSLNFSDKKHYQEITTLILSRSKDEEDLIHRVLDSFGISYVYKLYEEETIDTIIRHIGQKKNLYQIIVIKDKVGFDGFSIARKIKESNLSYNFIILLISSNNRHGNYIKSRELDIDYYIIKPYGTIEILDILNEIFPLVNEGKSIAPYINCIKPDLKILVTEGYSIHPGVTQTIFKYLGYEIDIAINGAEALTMMEAKKYDIVFIDIFMPGTDGFAVCKSIRTSDSKMPVIAMSASENDYDRARAKSAGMNDFLIKPIHIEAVKKILIEWFSESV